MVNNKCTSTLFSWNIRAYVIFGIPCNHENISTHLTGVGSSGEKRAAVEFYCECRLWTWEPIVHFVVSHSQRTVTVTFPSLVWLTGKSCQILQLYLPFPRFNTLAFLLFLERVTLLLAQGLQHMVVPLSPRAVVNPSSFTSWPRIFLTRLGSPFCSLSRLSPPFIAFITVGYYVFL